jgi:integrase
MVFNIDRDAELGRTVKTEASIRRVPVHSFLIELSLLRYRENIKKARHNQLFPQLKNGKHRGKGDAVSKFWGRYLDTLGITDSSKTLHSFRHTVRTRLLGQVERSMVDRLGFTKALTALPVFG